MIGFMNLVKVSTFAFEHFYSIISQIYPSL